MLQPASILASLCSVSTLRARSSAAACIGSIPGMTCSRKNSSRSRSLFRSTVPDGSAMSPAAGASLRSGSSSTPDRTGLDSVCHAHRSAPRASVVPFSPQGPTRLRSATSRQSPTQAWIRQPSPPANRPSSAATAPKKPTFSFRGNSASIRVPALARALSTDHSEPKIQDRPAIIPPYRSFPSTTLYQCRISLSADVPACAPSGASRHLKSPQRSFILMCHDVSSCE